MPNGNIHRLGYRRAHLQCIQWNCCVLASVYGNMALNILIRIPALRLALNIWHTLDWVPTGTNHNVSSLAEFLKLPTHHLGAYKNTVSLVHLPLNQNLSYYSSAMHFNVKNWKPKEKGIKEIPKTLPSPFPLLCLNPSPSWVSPPLVHRAENAVQLDVIMITIIIQIVYSTQCGAAQRIDGLVQSSRVSELQDWVEFSKFQCSPSVYVPCNPVISQLLY